MCPGEALVAGVTLAPASRVAMEVVACEVTLAISLSLTATPLG